MNMVLVNYVSYYATQVRGFMRGLSPEVIEELTGGLEADLIEAMSDGGDVSDFADVTINDLTDRFGVPEAYAKELCESAGIELGNLAAEAEVAAAKTAKVRKPVVRTFIASAKTRVAGMWKPEQLNPRVREFLVTCRPIWWALRAWLVYVIVSFFASSNHHRPFPADLAHCLLFAVIFLASVAVGIRWKKATVADRSGKVLVAVNVFVLLFAPYAYDSVNIRVSTAHSDGYMEGLQQAQNEFGILNQQTYANPTGPTSRVIDVGSSRNLYVYDSEGNFVQDARIMNESGSEVSASVFPARLDRSTRTIELLNARKDQYGRDVFNVFPATYTQVSLETDTCSNGDKEFWQGLMDAMIYEDWEDTDVEFDDAESQLGTLTYSVRSAQFRYGANSQEFFVGGSSNLTTDNDCLYGFKRPPVQNNEAPYIQTLPKLLAAEPAVTDGSAGGQEESQSKNSEQSGNDEPATNEAGKDEPAKEESLKDEAAKDETSKEASSDDLEQLEKELKEATAAKDKERIAELEESITKLKAS